MRNIETSVPEKRPVDVAQLEDRVMLSATPMAAALAGADEPLDATALDGDVQMAAAEKIPAGTETGGGSETVRQQRSDELTAQFQLSWADDAQQEIRHELVVIDTSATASYVLWSIKGGYPLASMMSQLPAWRFIDPLPVIDSASVEDHRWEDARQESKDDKVEQIVS